MTKSASGDALSVSCLLIPEIWLKITESLEYEPAMISCLKLINRKIYDIMRVYEKSISLKLGAPFEYLMPKSADLVRIVSYNPRELQSIPSYTYDSLKEIYTRERTLTYLASHELFSFQHSYFHVHLPSEMKIKTANKRAGGIVAMGLKLMFDMNDNHHVTPDLWQVQVAASTSRNNQLKVVPSPRSMRQKKLDFVSRLGPSKLATLLFVLHLSASGYKELYMQKFCTHDVSDLGMKSEYECVFREAVLRHGPNFIQALVRSDEDSSISATGSEWVRRTIDEGLQDLKWYEAGHIDVSRECSLQCFCYRIFCTKYNCDMIDGWQAIWDIVSKGILARKPQVQLTNDG